MIPSLRLLRVRLNLLIFFGLTLTLVSAVKEKTYNLGETKLGKTTLAEHFGNCIAEAVASFNVSEDWEDTDAEVIRLTGKNAPNHALVYPATNWINEELNKPTKNGKLYGQNKIDRFRLINVPETTYFYVWENKKFDHDEMERIAKAIYDKVHDNKEYSIHTGFVRFERP